MVALGYDLWDSLVRGEVPPPRRTVCRLLYFAVSQNYGTEKIIPGVIPFSCRCSWKPTSGSY